MTLKRNLEEVDSLKEVEMMHQYQESLNRLEQQHLSEVELKDKQIENLSRELHKAIANAQQVNNLIKYVCSVPFLPS